MKKIIATAVGLALLVSLPLVALADSYSSTGVDCTTKPTDQSCNLGNGDPNKYVNIWGLDGYDTPKVVAGTVWNDKWGLKEDCPLFSQSSAFPQGAPCNDIENTAYYIALMSGFSR